MATPAGSAVGRLALDQRVKLGALARQLVHHQRLAEPMEPFGLRSGSLGQLGRCCALESGDLAFELRDSRPRDRSARAHAALEDGREHGSSPEREWLPSIHNAYNRVCTRRSRSGERARMPKEDGLTERPPRHSQPGQLGRLLLGVAFAALLAASVSTATADPASAQYYCSPRSIYYDCTDVPYYNFPNAGNPPYYINGNGSSVYYPYYGSGYSSYYPYSGYYPYPGSYAYGTYSSYPNYYSNSGYVYPPYGYSYGYQYTFPYYPSFGYGSGYGYGYPYSGYGYGYGYPYSGYGYGYGYPYSGYGYGYPYSYYGYGYGYPYSYYPYSYGY